MKELSILLDRAGGLELEVREHPAWVSSRQAEEIGLKDFRNVIGKIQIVARSDLGAVSIIQSLDPMTLNMRFETLRLEGGRAEEPDIDPEIFFDRQACCRHVCVALAPVSHQVVKRWREKRER